MPNRYNTLLNNQPYVSTYVPLPLETIYSLGQDANKQLDQKIASGQDALDPLSKINISGTIKTYDQNSPTGDSEFDLGFINQKKNEEASALNQEREQLVNDYMSGKADKNTFDTRNRQLINKAKDTYSRYNAYTGLAKGLEAQQKTYAESKDYASKGYLANKALEAGTKLKQDILSGNIPSDYSALNIAQKVDRDKEIREEFKSLPSEVQQSYSSPTGNGYITTRYREGVTQDKINNHFDPWYQTSSIKEDILMEGRDLAARKGMTGNEELKEGTVIGHDNKGKEIKSTKGMTWLDAYEEQQVNNAFKSALGYESSKGRDDLKPDTVQLREMDKKDEEEQRKKAFELSEQFIASDPSTANNDLNFTKKIQSVLGDNYEYRDGKVHYNPVKEGTKYVNIFGKNINSDEAFAKGSVEINGVNFLTSRGDKNQLIVRLPKGDGWEYKTYPIKTKGKFEGIEQDTDNLIKISQRLGVNAKNSTDAMNAVDNYMNKVFNLETSSNAFPPEFSNWISKQFSTELDKEGNIIDPGQLSNVTIKNADGSVSLDRANNQKILQHAHLNGFNRSLTNNDLKAGDIEITGGDGKRYILNTGLKNIEKASEQSDRLLKSVNKFVMTGNRTNISDEQAKTDEKTISAFLKLKYTPNVINVINEEQDYEGNKYITYLYNSPNGSEMKTMILDENDRLKEAPINIGEASRRLSSSGLAKHLNFFNPKGTTANSKDYQKYQTTEETNTSGE